MGVTDLGRSRLGARLRRLWPYAAGAVALVVLLLVLLPGGGSPSLDERAQDVAGRLRCPTCVAESAADSTSPMAESMRVEIRRQLAAGRSEDRVIAWFRARYGNDIVLDPQRQGVGWLLWVAPPAAGLAVVAGYLVVRRRRPPADEPGASAASPLTAGRLAVALTVAVGAAVVVPLLVVGGSGDGSSASAPAETATPGTSSADPSTAASADPVTRAFTLLRSGRPAAAERLARPVADRTGADRPLALLVLGLAQRAEGEPAARRTLQRFLHRYPHHPAAADVRRLIGAAR